MLDLINIFLILGIYVFMYAGNVRSMVKFDAETKSHYWLTVCAQDHGIVPLHSCCEVCLCGYCAATASVAENIYAVGFIQKYFHNVLETLSLPQYLKKKFSLCDYINSLMILL